MPRPFPYPAIQLPVEDASDLMRTIAGVARAAEERLRADLLEIVLESALCESDDQAGAHDA